MTTDNDVIERGGRRAVTSLLLVLLLVLLFVVLVGAVFGRSVVEKVATNFILPPGLIFIGLAANCVYAWRTRAGKAHVMLATALLVLFCIVSNGVVANWLISTLERNYIQVDPLKSQPLDAIILLGGATEEQPAGGTQLNANGDRVRLAASLYHGGIADTILCTGEAIAGLSHENEADQAERLLLDLGVPQSAVQKGRGRNTDEEMKALSARFSAESSRIGVVTSAWHMPRVMRLARSAGVELEPLPADFRHEDMARWSWAKVVREMTPNHEAINSNSIAVREYFARIVGR